MIRPSHTIAILLGTLLAVIAGFYNAQLQHGFAGLSLQRSLPVWSHYEPLVDNRGTFRLLSIQPGNRSDPLKASLSIESFDEAPYFHVLGYTRSVQEADRWIVLDHQLLWIQRSVFEALVAERCHKYERLVWVDMVCVDQGNVTEKNYQMSQAYRIYEAANGLHVWLDSELGTLHDMWMTAEYWQQVSTIPELTLTRVVSFGNVQSARHVMYSLDWNSDLYRREHNLTIGENGDNRALQLNDFRDSVRGSSGMYCAATLISMFQNFFHQDPRDKIYALMGVASDTIALRAHVAMTYAWDAPLWNIYGATVVFQNRTICDQEERRIEMVYLSSLLRHILTRNWAYRPRQLTSNDDGFATSTLKAVGNYLKQRLLDTVSGSYQYYHDLPKHVQGGLFAVDGIVSRVTHVTRWAFDPPIWRVRPQMEPYWLESDVEDFTVWKVSEMSQKARQIYTRCRLIGQIQAFGPSLEPLLERQDVTSRMNEVVDSLFGELHHLISRLRIVRLLRILMNASNRVHVRRILSYVSRLTDGNLFGNILEHDLDEEDDPKVFLGSSTSSSQDSFIGLAPSQARVGDSICRFWNSTASAVVVHENDHWRVVGRAGVLTRDEGPARWDTPTNKSSFRWTMDLHEVKVDLALDLNMLTALGLDST